MASEANQRRICRAWRRRNGGGKEAGGAGIHLWQPPARRSTQRILACGALRALLACLLSPQSPLRTQCGQRRATTAYAISPRSVHRCTLVATPYLFVLSAACASRLLAAWGFGLGGEDIGCNHKDRGLIDLFSPAPCARSDSAPPAPPRGYRVRVSLPERATPTRAHHIQDSPPAQRHRHTPQSSFHTARHEQVVLRGGLSSCSHTHRRRTFALRPTRIQAPPSASISRASALLRTW